MPSFKFFWRVVLTFSLKLRKNFWVFSKILFVEDYLLDCNNSMPIRIPTKWRICEEAHIFYVGEKCFKVFPEQSFSMLNLWCEWSERNKSITFDETFKFFIIVQKCLFLFCLKPSKCDSRTAFSTDCAIWSSFIKRFKRFILIYS